MDGKRSPVAAAELLEPLKLTAINEHALSIDLQQVFGSGHGPSGAEERQSSHKETTSLLLSAKTLTAAIMNAR